MEFNQDSVFLFEFNDDIDKWRNEKDGTLYYFNNTLVDGENCLPTRVSTTKVFNYNTWQEWSSRYFIVDESESKGYTILLDVSCAATTDLRTTPANQAQNVKTTSFGRYTTSRRQYVQMTSF